ncbi:MAG: hypothetical protein MUP28_06080, partial [Candidatus Aminicenantes bacterium]|nr:hypothetical protein [Candidatus Aminicenantes bacterium]
QGSANRATELILIGKDVIKKIKTFFAPMKESAWAAHQEVVQKEKAELAKIEPVINALNGRVSNWRAEEDRKRHDAEAAAYRAEQLRIMAEAEAKRKAEEALRAAERAEAKGNQERADALIAKAAKIEEKAAAIPTPPPPIIPPKPVTDGLSMRDNWCFEVVDPMAVPRKYLTIDTVTIGKVVRVLKDQTSIPGIRVFNQPSMASIGIRNKA